MNSLHVYGQTDGPQTEIINISQYKAIPDCIKYKSKYTSLTLFHIVRLKKQYIKCHHYFMFAYLCLCFKEIITYGFMYHTLPVFLHKHISEKKYS